MTKTRIIRTLIFVALAVIFTSAYFMFFAKKNSSFESTDNVDIISILEANSDIKDYIDKYPSFKIQSQESLTEKDILDGQAGQYFKEVYEGLSLENGRYIKVQLMDLSGSNGFVAIIDLETETVEKAFGILLIQGAM